MPFAFCNRADCNLREKSRVVESSVRKQGLLRCFDPYTPEHGTNKLLDMSDDLKLLAALITGGLSLLGTVYNSLLSYLGRREHEALRRSTEAALKQLDADLTRERDERLARLEKERVISRFRDPLSHAAYDLQSRIYNIIEKEFMAAFYINGTNRDQVYAVENTVFLIAQFLGWTELIRQDVRFIDLGDDDETRKLRALQDRIYSIIGTDRLGRSFRLFAGEQRAVGELMVNREGESPSCIGYAEFLEHENPGLDHFLDVIRDDLKAIATSHNPFNERLVAMQHALIDLLDFLDPNHVYFSAESRSKL